jgi:7-carboxy-7-deazaguanine synthase
MNTYRINEIFYSLQGEGVRAGTPALFLRFAGCNQVCTVDTVGFDCDTEHAAGRDMALAEIIASLRKAGPGCEWVVLTGGEPGLQVDKELIYGLHAAGYRLAIETNGTIGLPAGLDWITVSPKVPEDRIRQRTAHEVKYVCTTGQPIPTTTLQADHYLISPAFQGSHLAPETLEWCIRLVRENPRWRLSVQLHKLWDIR